MRRTMFGGFLMAGLLSGGATALAEPIELGDGPDDGRILFNWYDVEGELAHVLSFDVAFESPMAGPAFIDLAADGHEPLELRWEDFGFGEFLDAATDASADDPLLGDPELDELPTFAETSESEAWWRLWLDEEGSGAWSQSEVGISDIEVTDQTGVAWVYGSNATPIPEPGTLALLAGAGAAALMRRARA